MSAITQGDRVLWEKDIRGLVHENARVACYGLQVCIIDDQPELVAVMADILSHWPGVKVEIIVPGLNDIRRALEADMLLLDHYLSDKYSGMDVLRNLRESGFQGRVISISGSKRYEYADAHFPYKAEMISMERSRILFIDFMNRQIKLLR